MSASSTYILAINCGSSSIKAKLFEADSLGLMATVTVKNIAARGEKVRFAVRWEDDKLGSHVDEQGEDGDKVEYKSLPPILLDKLVSSSKIDKSEIKYITHRVVHGGPHTEPIVVTRDHTEGLDEMDKLSSFAPLHNHSAVLAVRACLDALPDHTSVLYFDTLFHQTLPKEVYTYAIPPADQETAVPLRKYGFHGLSYMFILRAMAAKLKKKESEVSIVVAHLGSGGSACCIKQGKSIDTTMGLTPLEGFVGGTRCGSIDPVAVFHLVKDCSEDAGLPDIKVTKAEMVLNKKCGLQALAGTSNFGAITNNMLDPSSTQHESAKLAYDVYLDRVFGYITQYLGKLYSTSTPVDGLVFSGGIGEKSDHLRADVAKRLKWLGAALDDKRNQQASRAHETVIKISTEVSKLDLWVVQTDEEEVCGSMCKEKYGL